MLSPSSRIRIKEILSRLAKGIEVSLEERLFIQQLADQDQTIGSWLKRARRVQQNEGSSDSIDVLLNGLDLGSTEPNSFYKPSQEDLGDWCTGAPSWVTRS